MSIWPGVRRRAVLLATLVICLGVGRLGAGTITLTGQITQSPSDGNLAVDNSSLNSLTDGSTYIVSLTFPGSISSTGTYSLAGATFIDGTASETAFGAISLTITNAGGGVDDLSLLACITTGSGCGVGNFLAAEFSIPASGLNLQNVPASPIPALTPMDFEEDDGSTDVQGSVAHYSYIATQGTPEPSTFLLLGTGAMLIACRRLIFHK